MEGLGFEVWGVESRVWGLRFGIQGSGSRVEGSGFGVWGLRFGVQGSGFRVSGFGVEGSGYTCGPPLPLGPLDGDFERFFPLPAFLLARNFESLREEFRNFTHFL